MNKFDDERYVLLYALLGIFAIVILLTFYFWFPFMKMIVEKKKIDVYDDNDNPVSSRV